MHRTVRDAWLTSLSEDRPQLIPANGLAYSPRSYAGRAIRHDHSSPAHLPPFPTGISRFPRPPLARTRNRPATHQAPEPLPTLPVPEIFTIAHPSARTKPKRGLTKHLLHLLVQHHVNPGIRRVPRGGRREALEEAADAFGFYEGRQGAREGGVCWVEVGLRAGRGRDEAELMVFRGQVMDVCWMGMSGCR
jgi:hypothetical protein